MSSGRAARRFSAARTPPELKPAPAQTAVGSRQFPLVFDLAARRYRGHPPLDKSVDHTRFILLPERVLYCLFRQAGGNTPGAQVAQYPHLAEPVVFHTICRVAFGEARVV